MTTIPGDQAPPQPSTEPRSVSNLRQRVLTGVVALPVVLTLVFLGGWAFLALAVLLATIGVLEFCALGRHRDVEGNGAVGAITVIGILAAFSLRVYPAAPVIMVAGAVVAYLIEIVRHPGMLRRNLVRAGTTLAGVIYIGLPACFLVAVRGWNDGLLWVLTILLLTWGTDSLAYIGGRLWGRTKLAPTISPKKTVEGAVAGVVGGILPAALVLGLGGKLTPATLVLLGVGPLMAILGDLVESGLKRAFQVKDSHIAGFDVFPGHGGVLDRIDGLILVTVFSTLYLLATGLGH